MAEQTHVILVDDSAVARGMWTRALQDDSDIIVKTAFASAKQAIDYLKLFPVDVVILDIEMPDMDGLTAIPLIRKARPEAKILIASAHSKSGSENAMKALTLGAADIISKPSSLVPGLSLKSTEEELRSKVRALGRRKGMLHKPAMESPYLTQNRVISRPEILVVGTSTGGPPALIEFFKALPKSVDLPVLLVQHMPPLFTGILAKTLSHETQWKCREAKNDDAIVAGEIRIAPGDFHLRVTRGFRLALDQAPPENYCRPAVDPLFRSAADVFGEAVLGVVLTGMGEDGKKGAQSIVDHGGVVFAQDEASSTVWGMPGAVVRAGLASFMGPVPEIVERVARAYQAGIVPRGVRQKG